MHEAPYPHIPTWPSNGSERRTLVRPKIMDASLDVVELVQRVHRNNCWTPLGPLFLKDGEFSIQKPPIFTPGEFLCQVYQPYGDAGLQRWGVIPRFLTLWIFQFLWAKIIGFNWGSYQQNIDFASATLNPIGKTEDWTTEIRMIYCKHILCNSLQQQHAMSLFHINSLKQAWPGIAFPAGSSCSLSHAFSLRKEYLSSRFETTLSCPCEDCYTVNQWVDPTLVRHSP